MCLLATQSAPPRTAPLSAGAAASGFSPRWPEPRRPDTARLVQVLDLILPTFSPAARRRLARAHREDRLIRSAYIDADGRACILHALDPAIRSRADRIHRFAVDRLLLHASEELVIGWDSGQITKEMLHAALRRAGAS